MTIEYIKDTDNPLLKITAKELDDFVDNIVDYTGLTITTNLGCTVDSDTTIDTVDIVDNTKNIYIENKILYIKPQYFSSQTSFVDGIYKIYIEFNKATGYIGIHNCYFVDVTLKCKVASLLQNIVEENKAGSGEPISTIAHTLHYSLVNGSNCGCNCEELCEVFNALLDLLLNVDTKLVNNCGC